MYQEERLKKILFWLESEQVLSNQQLMERLHISRDTARRDIIKLTEEGKAIRTHGGIAVADFRNQISNYQSRKSDNVKGKKKIAAKVAELLPENSICFFDTSTFMPYVCRNLKKMKVYTHSLDNLELLANHSNIDVYALGGNLNKENRFFYGPGVMEKLTETRFDIAILGVAAIEEDGLYYADEEDAYIKQLAAKKADQVIVMADHPKFQRKGHFQAIKFSDIDLMILDREPSACWKERFEREKMIWTVT